MLRLSSSPHPKRLLPAALAIGLAVVCVASAAAQQRLTAARVQTRLERLEQQAKGGDWKRVEHDGERLLRDLQGALISSGGAGDEWSQIVAMVSTLRALAASAEGRTEDALWHWPLAQSLWPDLSRFTLSAYGEPAVFLRENRLDWQPSTCCDGEDCPGEEGTMLTAEGEVQRPVRIEGPQPKYPLGATLSQAEDKVFVRSIIGIDGRVRQPFLDRYRSLALALAAVEPLPRWRFEPATLDGVPIEVQYCLAVNFIR